MTQNIKNFIEEGEPLFNEKFGMYTRQVAISQTPDDIKNNLPILYTDISNELKQFIFSRQISLIKMKDQEFQDKLKMIIDMIKSKKKKKKSKKPCPDEIIGCYVYHYETKLSNKDKSFNQALDTISSKLKELTKE